MKKIFTTTIISLMALTALTAAKREISIEQTHVEKIADNVVVSFTTNVGKRAVRGSTTILVLPSLEGSGYSWDLPAIKIQNKRAAITEFRAKWAANRENEAPLAEILDAKLGETLYYKSSVGWQPWMEGANLVAEVVEISCCSYDYHTPMLLAENLTLMPTPKPIREIVVVEEPKVEEPVTIGEKLAVVHPYVLPASKYETIEPGQLFDEDRENSLSVFFKQGSYNVDISLGDNSQALIDLMTSIRMIENSFDSKVKSIIIAGFSSPEGSFEVNDRLAWNRAVAVKEYILDHSELSSNIIQIYNGSVDWRGLRILVEESDMYMRSQVLDIIDNMPVWDSQANKGRLGELMRLNGGRPYKYMYKNFFPKLRNAAYIKVYFENKE